MTSTIPLRAARDRLIDLLINPLPAGQTIGQTAPLRDLVVANGSDQIVVGHKAIAKISIENSQIGVLYRLFQSKTDQEAPKDTQIQAVGNWGTLILETPPITEDLFFHIRAEKPPFAATLYRIVNVRVGLDTTLKAWIEAGHLNPATGVPGDNRPRLVDYGRVVEVSIEKPQEGVSYRLIQINEDKETIISLEPIVGKGEMITLRTKSGLLEDTIIRVRATKEFDSEEKIPKQSAVLDIQLPVKVRPNPGVAVSVSPGAIVPYQTAPTLQLAAQADVSYQVFLHTVRDREFVRSPLPDQEALRVAVPNMPEVVVRQPPYQAIWMDAPDAFTPYGDPQQGTGSDVEIPLPTLIDETVLIIQASKLHQSDEGLIPSSVSLRQAILILVEPNPAPPLHIQAVQDEQTAYALEISGGQPGVFYTFHLTEDGEAIAPPVYFHKRDDEQSSFNKGVNQLGVEIDFVIARSYSSGASASASDTPSLPRITINPLAHSTALYARAMKAQTRVSAPLDAPIKVTGFEASPAEIEASGVALPDASVDMTDAAPDSSANVTPPPDPEQGQTP